MKKKFLALALCLTMTATMLAGCGGNNKTASTNATTKDVATNDTATNDTATNDTATNDTAKEPTADTPVNGCAGVEGLNIGVCIYKFDDNFMTLYRNELQSYLEAGGASVTVMDGKNDQAEQTNQIQNFITEGVDILIVNLVQSSAAEQITDQCNTAGIPVVFINREPENAEKQRWTENAIKATYVGADARQSGTYQGEIVLALQNKGDINGDGTVSYVMVIGDPENVDAKYRTEFSIKALTDAGMKVEELDAQRGDWDQARGQEIVANALTANGEKVEVVFCNNDAMALGAKQAIEAAGRTVGKDIYLLGVDALTDALEGVLAGTITGTVFNDHIGQSHTAADAAASFAAGETLESLIGVDYIKVTQDNAQEILDLLK